MLTDLFCYVYNPFVLTGKGKGNKGNKGNKGGGKGTPSSSSNDPRDHKDFNKKSVCVFHQYGTCKSSAKDCHWDHVVFIF